MDPLLQPLLARLNHLPDEFREIREGVQKAIRIADEDAEMALTRVRKVLELVVREVYERRCREPPGTRPLENLLQRLVKDGHLPARLDAYAAAVRKLGNVGTHAFGEAVTAGDVHRSLAQLAPILEWYFRAERPGGSAVASPPGHDRGTGQDSPGGGGDDQAASDAEVRGGSPGRPAAASSSAYLELASGPGQGTRYPLDKDRVLIGRSDHADIQVTDPSVSRYAAQLLRTDDGFAVEDTETRNGLHVNGRRTSGRVPLQDQDRIHVGRTIFVYHARG